VGKEGKKYGPTKGDKEGVASQKRLKEDMGFGGKEADKV